MCVFAGLTQVPDTCEYACSQPTQPHQGWLAGAGCILVSYGVPMVRFTASVTRQNAPNDLFPRFDPQQPNVKQ